MSTPYERKITFRANLLHTFRKGDPEGLDALLESPNPFGHFNFRCHHNKTLPEAIYDTLYYTNHISTVILVMYNKLIERGLDDNITRIVWKLYGATNEYDRPRLSAFVRKHFPNGVNGLTTCSYE